MFLVAVTVIGNIGLGWGFPLWFALPAMLVWSGLMLAALWETLGDA